jgi:septum formation protein
LNLFPFQQLGELLKRSLCLLFFTPVRLERRRVGRDTRAAGSIRVQRHDRQRQQQLFLDQLADTDAAVGSEHRLELLGDAIHVGLRSDQPDFRRGIHTNIQRAQATLTHQAGSPAHRQLGDGNTRRTSKMHTPMHLSRHVGELRAQTGELSERNGKIDVGFSFREPIDIERLRPGRRHGARIIGIEGAQVKILLTPKPLFRLDMNPLILASTSPYRRMLLERFGLTFETVRPQVSEDHLAGETPTDRAMRLAMAKAEEVSARYPGAVVIGSDQVAASGHKVLDKPGDAVTCRSQLATLSGTDARFHTACAVIGPAGSVRLVHLDTTTVFFRQLTAKEIERYVEREKPFDCAGGFKAEALGITLFESIESKDPTALIGLPLIWLACALRRAGYPLP